jgi:hypothetical protein
MAVENPEAKATPGANVTSKDACKFTGRPALSTPTCAEAELKPLFALADAVAG